MEDEEEQLSPAEECGLVQLYAKEIAICLRSHPDLLQRLLPDLPPPSSPSWESSLDSALAEEALDVPEGLYAELLPLVEEAEPGLARSLSCADLRSPHRERFLQIARVAEDLITYMDAEPTLSSPLLPADFVEAMEEHSAGQAERLRFLLREVPRRAGADWWLAFLKLMGSDGDNVVLRDAVQPDAGEWIRQEEERREEEAKQRAPLGAADDEAGWGSGFRVAEEADVLSWEAVKAKRRAPPKGPTAESDQLGQPVEPYTLRLYQNHLARRPAEQGKNALIVAPTGSGKTLVAVHIIRSHLSRLLEKDCRQGKAVFVVPTLPLAEQQTTYLRRFLRDRWRVGKIVGGGSEAPKGTLFRDRDVVVATPASLINLLETPSREDKIRITDISLLVFDEAHHCDGKHAYMSLMVHYLDLKLARAEAAKKAAEEGADQTTVSDDPELPQVVGMTASVGGAKAAAAAYETGPTKRHIYQLAGNLDAQLICTVASSPEAKASLEEAVPRPEDVLSQVAPDFHRFPFAIHLDDLMDHVENGFITRVDQLVAQGVPALEGVPPRKEYKRFTEAYGNRISTLLSKLPSLPDSTADKRTLITRAEHLKVYHAAFELLSQLPSPIVYAFLEERFAGVDERVSDATDVELGKLRRACFSRLRGLEARDNSLVLELYRILRSELLEKDEATRGIVFVKTRDLAHLLRKALLQHRELGRLAPEVLTSSNTSDSKGGQSEEEQKASLLAFREGRSRLLVATTVGEEGLDIHSCNLIVKYNQVSSEAAMVQKRGRGRAAGAKSYLLVQDNETAGREMENKRREACTIAALEEISDAGMRFLAKEVARIQAFGAARRAEEAEALARKKAELGDKAFELLCRKCDALVASSDSIRRVHSAHYCCFDPKIWERCVILPHHSPKAMYDVALAGVLDCGKCRHVLGNVLRFRSTYLPALKAAELMVVERESPANRQKGVQWKQIEETKFVVPPALEPDLARMFHSLCNIADEVAAKLDGIVAEAEERQEKEGRNF